MANARLQLLQDVYMSLDGQWQIVLSGSIFDVPVPHNFSTAHVQSVAETPNAVTKPTSVRGVRCR
jgi:hypothetical protein